jgi:pyruvate/2-oxoglutarate dehydrogenase complex dihydrolipoamide acyltransferase (E2) component
MTQGRIVKWLKQEGEAVKEGDAFVSIETDKAEMEVQSPGSGILRRVLVGPGQDVDVGTPLAILAGPEENIDAFLIMTEAPSKTTVAPAPALLASPQAAGLKRAAGGGTRQPVSPLARRVARELGVDLSCVVGTGAGGLVTEGDVRMFASQSQPSPAREDSENADVIPFTGLRRRIAERLSLSRHTAADVTTVTDVDMTEIAALRKASRLSYTAYVVGTAAKALRMFPILNAALVGDQILVKREIHVGVAVALDRGLVVPVVRFADRKGVEEISREIDALAVRAQDGQLTPDDLSGSTFTVTNSGAFGSLLFTPIINQPEVAILGMGKVAETPAVRDGQVVVRQVMYLCLTYDHRVVDGRPAVQFLNVVKRQLEEFGIHR